MQEEIKIIVLNSEGLQQFAHLIPDKLKDTAGKRDSIVLGALAQEKVAMGVAVFSEYSHYMELLWIYVEPEFRELGIGKALINRLTETIEDSNYFRGVFADYIREDNYLFDTMLDSIGFIKEQQDWASYSFHLNDAYRLDRFIPGSNQQQNIKGLCRISDCNDTMKKHFSYMLSKSDEIYQIELPVRWNRYDDVVSCVHVTEGEISAVLLMETTKDRINISFAYAKENPYVFPYMLGFSFGEACKRYKDRNPEVTVTALEESAENLLLKLVPDAKNVRVTHAQKNR